MSPIYLILALSVLAQASFAGELPNKVSGPSLASSGTAEVKAGAKGLVVAFLSARCPCSNSHTGELKSLAKEFPGFSFVGVHANGDEPLDLSQKYFKEAALEFPVIRDGEQKLLQEFRALKTPHAFVVSPAGALLYKGGVSSSSDFARADHKYLREALEDLDQGRVVRTPSSRTLGCVIARGGRDAE